MLLYPGFVFFQRQGGEESLRGGCPGDCRGHITSQETVGRQSLCCLQLEQTVTEATGKAGAVVSKTDVGFKRPTTLPPACTQETTALP